jgi:16S rRNA G966 N2-methylase RsmD
MKQIIINIFKTIKRSFFFKPWATKPLEFWAILNLILIKTKPESILELGSGRSTFYLYEYAIKYNKKLESVEHNSTYLRFIQKSLKSVFGKSYNYMKLVPIKDDWYDTSKIKTNFDFLFIDGPNAHSFLRTNISARSSKKAIEFLRDKIKNCKIIIIDDTNRSSIIDLISNLNIQFKYKEFIYNSYLRIKTNDEIKKIRVYYQIQYEDFVKNMSKLILQETDPEVLKIEKY